MRRGHWGQDFEEIRREAHRYLDTGHFRLREPLVKRPKAGTSPCVLKEQ